MKRRDWSACTNAQANLSTDNTHMVVFSMCQKQIKYHPTPSHPLAPCYPSLNKYTPLSDNHQNPYPSEHLLKEHYHVSRILTSSQLMVYVTARSLIRSSPFPVCRKTLFWEVYVVSVEGGDWDNTRMGLRITH